MRNHFMHLVLTVSVVATCLTTWAAEDVRDVFQFGEGANSGFLIHDYANCWIEFGATNERFLFVEVARTEDSIELRDPGRNVGLKIFADHGDLLLNGSTAWQPWQKGKWMTRDELPKTVTCIPTDRNVRLAYFVPADREPIENYEQKIRVVMQVVAELYRTDFKAKDLHSDGFTLQSNDAGQPIVHLIRSEKEAKFYNGAPDFDDVKHFQKIGAEIPASVGSRLRHMIVLFAETYEPGPAPIEWNGSVGRGLHTSTDGGLGIMSSWILRDEFCATNFEQQKKMILDITPITGRTALGTRLPNSPRFEFIEDGFGAVAHELGHALGLPHDYRQQNDLMGHGFRRMQVNFQPTGEKSKLVSFSRDNARLLSVSRYLFSDVDRSDNLPPTGELSVRLSKGTNPTATVSLKAADDVGLRTVVFFDPQNDTVVGSHELKGRSQTIEQKLAISAIKPGEFKLVALLADGGGNVTHVTAAASPPK